MIFVLCTCSVTLSTRGKGKKQDYRFVKYMFMIIFVINYIRFMAEPDLAPLVLSGKDDLLSGSEIQYQSVGTATDVDKLRSKLPELPMQTRSRLKTQYGVCCFYMIIIIWLKICLSMSVFPNFNIIMLISPHAYVQILASID